MISCSNIYNTIRDQKFFNDGIIGIPVTVGFMQNCDMIEITFVDMDSDSPCFWRESYSIKFIDTNNGKDFYKQLYRNHYLFDNRFFKLVYPWV